MVLVQAAKRDCLLAADRSDRLKPVDDGHSLGYPVGLTPMGINIMDRGWHNPNHMGIEPFGL